MTKPLIPTFEAVIIGSPGVRQIDGYPVDDLDNPGKKRVPRLARREKRQNFFARMHEELERALWAYWDALPEEQLIAETSVQQKYLVWHRLSTKDQSKSLPDLHKECAPHLSFPAFIKALKKAAEILGEERRPSKTRPSRKK